MDQLLRRALGALHAKLVLAHMRNSGVEARKVTDFTLQQSMPTCRCVGSSSGGQLHPGESAPLFSSLTDEPVAAAPSVLSFAEMECSVSSRSVDLPQ